MARLTFWLAAANAVQLALGLARSVALGRWLGPGLLGELGYALALVAILDAVAQAGIATIVTRDAARRPRDDGAILGSALALRGAFAAAAGALLWPLAGPWAALMLLGTVGQAGTAILRAKLLRGSQIAANLLPGILSVGAILAAVLWAQPAAGLALALLAVASVAASGGQVALALARLRGRLRATRAAASRLLGEAWPLWLSSILVACAYRISILMMKWLLLPGQAQESIGYYQVSYSLVESGNFLLGALVIVALPHFSSLQSGPAGRLEGAWKRSLRWGLMLGGGAFLATLVVGSPFIRVLYGGRFAPSVPSLFLLSPILLLTLLNSLASSRLVSAGRQVEVLGIGAAMLTVNALLNLYAIPAWGHPGAAAATTLTELVALGLFVLRVRALRNPAAISKRWPERAQRVEGRRRGRIKR